MPTRLWRSWSLTATTWNLDSDDVLEDAVVYFNGEKLGKYSAVKGDTTWPARATSSTPMRTTITMWIPS
ncbi:MAG: hypothetical protein V8R40_14875 [Dysosmobacter sp.]